MNTLDSRHLRLGDCFAQKFTTKGKIQYFLSSGSAKAGDGNLIEVIQKTGTGDPKLYTVVVKRGGAGLVADPDNLKIEVGDNVLWHTGDATVTGFAVDGTGPGFTFSSGALRNEAVFTHAFGIAGNYEWIDPLHGQLSGVVEVQAVVARTEAERKRWYETLKKDPKPSEAFQIKNGKVSPAKLQVMVGQTVFWKVWDGNGMAIVDKRLPRTP
jgi:plastocyanin